MILPLDSFIFTTRLGVVVGVVGGYKVHQLKLKLCFILVDSAFREAEA
jgi:hypothetical protein